MKRLLVLTQAVDETSDVLGFFHGWLTEFSGHFDTITVVALGVGKYDLPKNIRVFSLGKEKISQPSFFQRIRYIVYFLGYIVRFRKGYDSVFVHMNEEYVLLGGLLWRFLGKKVSLWRNHKKGSFKTRIAVMLSHVVFHTSPDAFVSYSQRARVMPVGIDTNLFKQKEGVARVPHSILSLGRISPVKKVEIFIEALTLLDKEGTPFIAAVYGNCLERDKDYFQKIKIMGEKLVQKGRLSFNSGVPNNKTSEIYNTYEIYVNQTPGGSFDKTILEAASCGTLALSCNDALRGDVPEDLLFKEGDASGLARKIKKLFSLSDQEKENYREILQTYVEQKHSLHLLAKEIGTQI